MENNIKTFDNYLLHSIGKIGEYDIETEIKEELDHYIHLVFLLERIEKIKQFGILSYKQQIKKIGNSTKLSCIGFNGEDYISVSDPTLYKNGISEIQDDIKVYQNPYENISVIISKEIIKCIDNRKVNEGMHCELQFKDCINKEYILGLRIPSIYSSDKQIYEYYKNKIDKFYLTIFEKNTEFISNKFKDLNLYASFTGERIKQKTLF